MPTPLRTLGDAEGRAWRGTPPRSSYCSAALGSVGGILRSGRGGGSGARERAAERLERAGGGTSRRPLPCACSQLAGGRD